MFCSACGQPVDQPYCQKCGAPSGLTVGAAVPTVSRVAAHLRTLGILWIAYAIYELLRLALIAPLLHVVLGGRSPWIDNPSGWTYSLHSGGYHNPWVYAFHPGGWLLHVIMAVVIVRSVLSLIVGFGLLRTQPWGRVAAIILAILTLIKPLLGTILAIYTLWVLLSRNAGPEYDRIASLQPPL
jgi:hypothetical protein